MSEVDNNENPRSGTPPYVSWPSVKNALSIFKEHDLPERIDRSVLRNFSGSVGSQLLTAFRFLRLTDANNFATEAMRALVDSVGTDKWQETLRGIIKSAYGPIFDDLNLAVASPAQFNEKFRNTYQGADEVLRKSMTFFLNAASDAEIPVSSFILKARKPRGTSPPKRRPNKQNSNRHSSLDRDPPPPPPPPDDQHGTEIVSKLLDKFPSFDPQWDATVQAKWFEAFETFMSKVEGQKK